VDRIGVADHRVQVSEQEERRDGAVDLAAELGLDEETVLFQNVGPVREEECDEWRAAEIAGTVLVPVPGRQAFGLGRGERVRPI
jgi:hypothetical protein